MMLFTGCVKSQVETSKPEEPEIEIPEVVVPRRKLYNTANSSIGDNQVNAIAIVESDVK
jgi:hypothetical protein